MNPNPNPSRSSNHSTYSSALDSSALDSSPLGILFCLLVPNALFAMGGAAYFQMIVALLPTFGGSFALGADLRDLVGLVRSKK
jgi:hypothetical protein